jgi:hypothetical protein
MTLDQLIADLKTLMPNTDIKAGEKPGRICVTWDATGQLWFCLSKSLDRVDQSNDDPPRRPTDHGSGQVITAEFLYERIKSHVTYNTGPDPRAWNSDTDHKIKSDRIRVWTANPDILKILRWRVEPLIVEDMTEIKRLEKALAYKVSQHKLLSDRLAGAK